MHQHSSSLLGPSPPSVPRALLSVALTLLCCPAWHHFLSSPSGRSVPQHCSPSRGLTGAGAAMLAHMAHSGVLMSGWVLVAEHVCSLSFPVPLGTFDPSDPLDQGVASSGPGCITHRHPSQCAPPNTHPPRKSLPGPLPCPSAPLPPKSLHPPHSHSQTEAGIGEDWPALGSMPKPRRPAGRARRYPLMGCAAAPAHPMFTWRVQKPLPLAQAMLPGREKQVQITRFSGCF